MLQLVSHVHLIQKSGFEISCVGCLDSGVRRVDPVQTWGGASQLRGWLVLQASNSTFPMQPAERMVGPQARNCTGFPVVDGEDG